MKDVIIRTLGAWCLLLAASASQAELVEFRDDDANAESIAKETIAVVTAVTAQQRYPWNGMVDVAVTLSGSSNEVARAQCAFVATNRATLAALDVSHLSGGGVVSGGGNVWTRHFVWDAAADVGEVQIDDVELAVAVKEKSPDGVQLWEDGPYWAECNVGAAKPEDSGYYFWWGDTVGYRANTNSATWSDNQGGWSNVKWESSAGVEMSDSPFRSADCPTYDKSFAYLRQNGYLDDSDNLASSCDAASAHLGAPWRMPTSAEIDALKEKCQKTYLVTNGVWGCLVTGQGEYSSRSIFLPAAGYGGGSDLYSSGSKGFYWSASPNPAYAPDTWNLYLDRAFSVGTAMAAPADCPCELFEDWTRHPRTRPCLLLRRRTWRWTAGRGRGSPG